MADRLADGGAADGQRLHQFALGRQTVASPQPGVGNIIHQRLRDLPRTVHRRQRPYDRPRRLLCHSLFFLSRFPRFRSRRYGTGGDYWSTSELV